MTFSRSCLLAAFALVACQPTPDALTCTSDDDCPRKQQCSSGRCVATDAGAVNGGGTSSSMGGGSASTGGGSATAGGGSSSTGGGSATAGGVAGGAATDGGTRVGEGTAADSCFDQSDNDADGLVDCADPDCNAVQCRAATGACDAVERCTALACPGDVVLPPNTPCGSPSCVNGQTFPAPLCTAAASCAPQAPVSCNGHQCNGAVCRTNCQSDADCLSTHVCSTGACLPKKSSGTACSRLEECTSGFCTDGVCCESSCNGPCQVCTAAGTCSNRAAGTDPESGCGTFTCDGTGACHSTCSATCSSACKAPGYCSGTTCQSAKPDQSPCTAACECASGACTSFFADTDGDTFGGTASAMFCGTRPPAGFATRTGDCCDMDARAKPGGAAQTTASQCGGFDFDCNGTTERTFTTLGLCTSDVGGSCSDANNCPTCTDAIDGWSGATVPACGAAAPFATCQMVTCPSRTACVGSASCGPAIATRTQSCK